MFTGRFIAIVPFLRAMPHVEALGGIAMGLIVA